MTTLKASTLAIMAHQKRQRDAIARVAVQVQEEVRAKKTAASRRPIGSKVIDEFERHPESGELVKVRRDVRKYLTTLDQLEKRNQLPKHLRMAFDELAAAVALSSGAYVDDKLNGSSSRGIANWEGSNGAQFGPRSMSDQMLKGERLRQYVLGQMPEDMMRLANQLLMEETGLTLERPEPLTSYGQQNGFNQEQQARSSGATMAIDVCRVVHHALKSR